MISGIADAVAIDGVSVYCAGVAAGPNAGELVTAGGRVLNVCGRAATLADARQLAYDGVDRISWRGMYYRTDIADLSRVLSGPPGQPVARTNQTGA